MSSPTAILSLLLPLALSHPSSASLLCSHRPLTNPSHLPAQQLNKYISRVNAAVLSRDEGERRAGCEIAKLVVEQDCEGWALDGWGRGWAGSCLGVLASQSTRLRDVPAPLALLKTILLGASFYPSFEREAVLPIMGKLSVTLLKLIERMVQDPQPDYPVLLVVLQTTSAILAHSSAPFRPTAPALRSLLLSLILQLPSPSSPAPTPIECPHEVRVGAADLLASLHLASGKAQSPSGWAQEMKDALGGVGAALIGISAEGWEEEPTSVNPPPAPVGLPSLPMDPSTRLPLALSMLEGWVEVILALLRYPTSRPVPVPIALLVSAGLRCLSLTLETPAVPYVSPQHHAALLSALPRIWTSGALLIGSVASAQSQLQLLRLHQLLLTLYLPALVPTEYSTRLLRFCITRMSPLLEQRPLVSAPTVNGSGGGGGGKRGKKRARGAEDGLVGGLEGRERRSIGDEVEIVLEALKLTPLLHETPLLSPSLLTFSIRLHLSIHLSLPSLLPSFSDPSAPERVRNAVRDVLEQAVLTSEEGGTARGWKSVILSVLEDARGRFKLLLHPSVPPLLRPTPPLSALHYFAPESEEEKRLRLEMGITTPLDAESAVASLPGRSGVNVLNDLDIQMDVEPEAELDVEIDIHHPIHASTAGREQRDDPRYVGAAPPVGITVPRVHHIPVRPHSVNTRNASASSETEPHASKPDAMTTHVEHDPRHVIPHATLTRPEEPIRVDAEEAARVSVTSKDAAVQGVLPHLDPGAALSLTKGTEGFLEVPKSKSTVGPSKKPEGEGMESKGKGKAVEEDDEGIPELDSGSSDGEFGEDDEDEEEEEA